MNILEKIASVIYLPMFKKLEREIGCGLIFKNIPSHYINGLVQWNMTKNWKRFGLPVKKGANYFTFGHIVNGISSRFDSYASEYQSWLGGYTVKFTSEQNWTPEEYFKLAIADQNSWLRLYGCPNPNTNIDNWKCIEVGKIQIGQYLGKLYEFGCNTQSDVGAGYNNMKLRLCCIGMAILFNLSNKSLNITGKELRSKIILDSYKDLKLKGYIAIFDIESQTKVMLYGNSTVEKFEILKSNLLEAMKSCEIITFLNQPTNEG